MIYQINISLFYLDYMQRISAVVNGDFFFISNFGAEITGNKADFKFHCVKIYPRKFLFIKPLDQSKPAIFKAISNLQMITAVQR